MSEREKKFKIGLDEISTPVAIGGTGGFFVGAVLGGALAVANPVVGAVTLGGVLFEAAVIGMGGLGLGTIAGVAYDQVEKGVRFIGRQLSKRPGAKPTQDTPAPG